jgi:hypothetical protein
VSRIGKFDSSFGFLEQGVPNFVYGYQNDDKNKQTFSYALPLVQAKILLKEYLPNKAPGYGFVVGSFLPGGNGAFKPSGYGTFGYLTLTQSFGKGDRLLLHANIGGNYLHIDGSNDVISTWGFGTQIKAYKGLYLVAEIFSGERVHHGRPDTDIFSMISYKLT